ncbi:MAG: alpha-L-arabinofuranosidase C-terminal domain-containing protein [Eisenbergiella sp.]
MRFVVDTSGKKEPLGDLYGIFFEDLNHAADGGLYAELIQNRAFEFDPVDNPAYTHLTGWEILGTEEEMKATVLTGGSVSSKNPHYLALDVRMEGRGAGIRNRGYHDGIVFEAGNSYRFSCWAKREQDREAPLSVSLQDENGKVLDKKEIILSKDWKKYEAVFTPETGTKAGSLTLIPEGRGRVYLDFVSLFPVDTYRNRPNGMRRRLAELLEAMHPKFMRFPGGCLVHDGALDPDARDAQYRWKNTVGPIEERPARRSNWGYHQTLGLGFYEYFQLCEDIGAKPLPVISPGYDPHHGRAAEPDEMQYFVDEALDLIEFANGEPSTKWGGLRAELGHPEPFGMEYLGIGNEEVGEGFFERYKIVADAVRARYPEIKLIGTASPFAAGGEYERGWRHAREDGADFVDEHYYMTPEWFLANHHRYDAFPAEGPKVFLGEYASWGNTWYNALCEASYMLGLERNAKAVGLSCYAPLFANADYVNWKPDMIWFDKEKSFGTANYHVQKLFMENLGEYRLDTRLEEVPEAVCLTEEPETLGGSLRLSSDEAAVRYSHIRLVDEESGRETVFEDTEICAGKEIVLPGTGASSYRLKCCAKELEGYKGFRIYFGEKTEQDRLCWSIGGWQNQDTSVFETISGRNSELSQYQMNVERGREYELELCVDNRRVRTFIDGKLFHDIEVKPVLAEPLYTGASLCENGDVIIKAVNVLEQPQKVLLDIRGMKKRETLRAKVEEMSGWEKDAENSFSEPDRIVPEEKMCLLNGSETEWTFAAQSVTFIRIFGGE